MNTCCKYFAKQMMVTKEGEFSPTLKVVCTECKEMYEEEQYFKEVEATHETL